MKSILTALTGVILLSGCNSFDKLVNGSESESKNEAVPLMILDQKKPALTVIVNPNCPDLIPPNSEIYVQMTVDHLEGNSASGTGEGQTLPVYPIGKALFSFTPPGNTGDIRVEIRTPKVIYVGHVELIPGQSGTINYDILCEDIQRYQLAQQKSIDDYRKLRVIQAAQIKAQRKAMWLKQKSSEDSWFDFGD